MTATFDIALPRVLTPTLDLRIDVGPLPGACEPTLVGPVAAPRTPFIRAPLQLPDLDSCTEDELADLAANAYDNEADLDVLTRSSPHVRAILGLFGRMELRADQVATLRNNVRQLSQQLTTAQDIGAKFKQKVDELIPMLTAERVRSARDAVANIQNVQHLTATMASDFHWRTIAARLEDELNEERILRVAAMQDAEDMRAVAIKRGEDAAELRRGKS